MLTFEQIKDLIAAVSENQLERVEIERSGFRLQIIGYSQPTVVAAPPPIGVVPTQPAVAAAGAAAPASATPDQEPVAAEAAVEAAHADAHLLTSPIVGTFYSAPSPDSDPFVRVGDRVTKGQVICIVEAMKLMNEIEADTSGVVLEIFPKNAQPVEFGEKLYAIQAD